LTYASSFLTKIEEYTAEDSVPADVPLFAQGIIKSLKPVEWTTAKLSASGNNTRTKSAKDKPDKKQQKKAGKKTTNYTKLSLFHSKEGVKDGNVFPNTLKQPLCGKLCLQGNACNKPKQVCKFTHAITWKSIKDEDQKEILKHCGATNDLWLDGETKKNPKT
jgi:hypothetical protein